jgi:hypothetical protein
MTNLRVIGVTWSALGLLGGCASLFDLVRNVVSHSFAAAIESDLIALAFCTAELSLVMGYFVAEGGPESFAVSWASFFCCIP